MIALRVERDDLLIERLGFLRVLRLGAEHLRRLVQGVVRQGVSGIQIRHIKIIQPSLVKIFGQIETRLHEAIDLGRHVQAGWAERLFFLGEMQLAKTVRGFQPVVSFLGQILFLFQPGKKIFGGLILPLRIFLGGGDGFFG